MTSFKQLLEQNLNLKKVNTPLGFPTENLPNFQPKTAHDTISHMIEHYSEYSSDGMKPIQGDVFKSTYDAAKRENTNSLNPSQKYTPSLHKETNRVIRELISNDKHPYSAEEYNHVISSNAPNHMKRKLIMALHHNNNLYTQSSLDMATHHQVSPIIGTLTEKEKNSVLHAFPNFDELHRDAFDAAMDEMSNEYEYNNSDKNFRKYVG